MLEILGTRICTGHTDTPALIVDVRDADNCLPYSLTIDELSKVWSHYTPSIQELQQRSYKGLHVLSHSCPHCGVDLIVNERADKTITPDRPFFTRRLVCPCWSTVGCTYKEKWTEAVMIELYLQAMKLESAEAEF